MPDKARAMDGNISSSLRQLAKESTTAPQYVDGVVALIKSSVKAYLDSPKGKQNPNGQYEIVNDIIAEAVKLRPPYACDIIKAGIQAVTPQNGVPDPTVVASMVAEVVLYIQTTNPELLETIVTCATEADPDAGKSILNAVAGILATPHSTLNNLRFTLPGGAVGPTPTPTPTPASTPRPVAPTPPPQVTPVAPI
ncbi:MAG: hypothetical protein WCD79_15685 [Chthoniobacteraceae bacterium]